MVEALGNRQRCLEEDHELGETVAGISCSEGSSLHALMALASEAPNSGVGAIVNPRDRKVVEVQSHSPAIGPVRRSEGTEAYSLKVVSNPSRLVGE